MRASPFDLAAALENASIILQGTPYASLRDCYTV
jgi:hypothetical protein